jgi:superfamily II DNA or RNA helicase
VSLFSRAELPVNAPLAGLRYYQEDAVNAIQAAFGEHRSALLVMATGLGKTETFGAIAAMWPGKVLVLVHRDELLDQARKRLEKMTGGEWVEVEQGKYHAQLTTRIVVASIQTVYQDHRLERFGRDHFSLVITDEAHHFCAPSFRKPLDYFTAKVLGVTATPDRGDKLALGQVFECNPYTLDIEDGIEAGYLVPVLGRRVWVDSLDISEVKVSAGKLNDGQLDTAVERATANIVKQTLELAGDRRGIAFFPGLKSAHLAHEIFNALRPGSACYIDGNTPDDEREETVRAFKRGQYRFLCNCNIATEGFDAPDVSVIIQARPTKSRALYAQMVGRGTRVLPNTVDHIPGIEGAEARRAAIAASAKPDMLILDFVGNAGKHSLCSVEDVLGGKYDEAEVVLAKKRTGAGEKSPQQALKEARAEISAMAKTVAAERKARATVEAFDPFAILGLGTTEDANDSATYGFTPPDARQRATLAKFGYGPKELEGVSRRAANKLVAESIKRIRGGLASFKQLRLLQRYGIADRNVTKARASEAIDYLATKNWRPEQSELRRIIHNRQIGEEG